MTNSIEARVIALVRELVPAQRSVELSSDFTRDLRIDSDDLSFLLVPRIEQEFGVSPPAAAWSETRTVADLVHLLKRHSASP